MKKFIITASFAFMSTISMASEYVSLFNGRDFDGWVGLNPHSHVKLDGEASKALAVKEQKELLEHWKVENGEIVNDGNGPYLTTIKSYENIELTLEVKMIEGSDSGIYLRGTPQVQLWDTREEAGKWKHGADKGSGGLWNNKIHLEGKDPLKHADAPIGSWNKLRILQLGARTSVWLNEVLVVDHVIMDNYWSKTGEPLPQSGPVMLQTHGAPVYWRNIQLREIDSNEAVDLLSQKSGEQQWKNITPDQVGAEQWKSTSGQPFEMANGVMSGGEGIYFYAAQEFSDYQFAFKFKLEHGSNNGLLIHYPGSGDGAYGGLCELQILDNDDPKYAKLDDRQYHGSAYGMKAAFRGALNPVGDWNHQIVTIAGRNITVELNGYEILRANLDEVKNFMGDKAHPGFDRKKGYVGFGGHNKPYVDFKALYIKELK